MSRNLDGEALCVFSEMKRGACVTLCHGFKVIKYALIPLFIHAIVTVAYEYYVRATGYTSEVLLPEILLSILAITTAIYFTIYVYRYFLDERPVTDSGMASLKFGKAEGLFFKWSLYIIVMGALFGLVFLAGYILLMLAVFFGGAFVGLEFSFMEVVNAAANIPQSELADEYLKTATFFDSSRVADWLMATISFLYCVLFTSFVATRYAFLFATAARGLETNVRSAKKLVSKQFRPLFLISVVYYIVIFSVDCLARLSFEKGSNLYFLFIGLEYVLFIFVGIFGAYITSRYYQCALDAK